MARLSEVDVPSGHGDPRGSAAALLEERFVPRPPRPERPARRVSARVSLRARIVEIWQARELLVFLVRKELKVKYKGSVLGFLWSMLNPAVVLIVYFLVFTYFLKSGIPSFAVYLFSGLLVWNMFATALMGSSSAIVGAAGIVKKVAFPREILAMSQVGTALVFFGFQSIVLVVFLSGFQHAPAWGYLPLIPFALVDLLILTTALSIFLSAVNVYMRDVEHLIAVLLQAWFWGVPIIYSFTRVWEASHRWVGYFFLADPLTPIVLVFQRAFYGHVSFLTTTAYPATAQQVVLNGKSVIGSIPAHVVTSTTSVLVPFTYQTYLEMLAVVLGGAVLLLLGAMLVFGRIEGNFAEEL